MWIILLKHKMHDSKKQWHQLDITVSHSLINTWNQFMAGIKEIVVFSTFNEHITYGGDSRHKL